MEDQVRVGMEILRAELARIANELNAPRVLCLSFTVTDRDFDFGWVSLVDHERFKIVMKIGRNDLADSGADGTIRRRMTRQLETAVRSYLTA